MKRIALLLAAGVLAGACGEPTQPGRENVTAPGLELDEDNGGRVVRVAAPTGNAAADVANIKAAVAAATPGAIIQFARGTYTLEPNTQIDVSVPRVTLQGHRRGTTIVGFFDPTFSTIHFVLNGGAQTVRRLTFLGFPLALLFEDPGTGGYRLEDCIFRNGDLPFLFIGSSDRVSRVRGNKFINVTLPFIIIGKTVHFRGNRVTSPNFADHPLGRPFNAGVLAPDGLPCENNVLEGNTVVGNADGFIVIAFDEGICRNNVIRKNTFINQRVLSEGDNGSMVWLAGPGADGNRIEGNVLRGSEGLGVVVEEGSDNRIVDNKFSDLPGGTVTFTPFSGTAIFLGEPTTGNRVCDNKFKRVVNDLVDLGDNIICRDDDDDDDGDDDRAAVTPLQLQQSGERLRTLEHPKLRFLRERMKD